MANLKTGVTRKPSTQAKQSTCFLVTSVLRFALLPYYRRVLSRIILSFVGCITRFHRWWWWWWWWSYSIPDQRKALEGLNNGSYNCKFSIKDFFSKCDQIHNFLRIWSHLLKKSLMENFIFCAVLALIFANQMILWTYWRRIWSFFSKMGHKGFE